MIGYVEKLPSEWESQWKSMKTGSSHDLTEENGEQINTYKLLNPLLTPLKVYEMSRLERKFAEGVHDPLLKPLLPVIQGLMRFLPSSRITADKALGLLGNCQK
jgi:hypothetical protein